VGLGNVRVPDSCSRPHNTNTFAAEPQLECNTKPEINFLIALATFTCFYLRLPMRCDNFPYSLLIHTLCPTRLVAIDLTVIVAEKCQSHST
jgi:hypothetical protein